MFLAFLHAMQELSMKCKDQNNSTDGPLRQKKLISDDFITHVACNFF